MRWILGLLVLVNLAILLWGSLSEEKKDEGELAMPGVGSIRLVGEAHSPQEQLVAEPATGLAVDQEEAAAPAVEVQASAEPRPPAETLAQSADEAAKPSVPVVKEQPARPRFCSRIGPFADGESSQAVQKYLLGRGGKVSTSEETLSMRTGYWVLIPPLANRAAAEAMGKKLTKKGIRDYWVMSKGPYRNGISLGVFSQESNARSFAKRMTRKGFDVTTTERLKERTVLWLDYEGEVFIPPAEIRSRVPNGVKVVDRDCP
jgi:cell division septation protein DedD